MNDIGAFIQAERKKNKISQRALADKAGISNTELWKIENGERVTPNPKNLNAIATALEINPKILLKMANYIDSTSHSNNDYTTTSSYTMNQEKLINFKNAIEAKILYELNIKFQDTLLPQNDYRIDYNTKLDTLCFSKSGHIIAIDYKFVISHKNSISNHSFFMRQLQRRVKSDLADFYFYFKKQVIKEDMLTFFCVFILNDLIEHTSFINSIDTLFVSYKPFFQYKIIYESEII